MNSEVLKGKIIEILRKHLLDSISIEEFIQITNILNLGDVNTKLRDYIVKEAYEKVNQMEFDSEWNLLEMCEKENKKRDD